MRYNFDEINNRRGTGCIKWDSIPDGVIPMWVADMDFKTAPSIVKAVTERAASGIYGYTHIGKEYFETVSGWFSRRHNWDVKPEWIQYTTGGVPALSACIKALTKPGDKVILMTPVYNCFFSSVRNNGCEVLENPLVVDKSKAQPTYKIDFQDLESKAKEAEVLLMCSPHNPAGRVWTKEELQKVAEICHRHSVVIVCDEIHCEFTMPGVNFVPFAPIINEAGDNFIIMNSATKAFNIAGLQIANIISDNPQWRSKIDKAININEICDLNPFGVIATMTAYSQDGEGEEWLGELDEYIFRNYSILKETLEKYAPEYKLFTLEGTYLAWVDCSPAGKPSSEIEKSLVENEKVRISSSHIYGVDGFIRVNLASPEKIFREGAERLAKGLSRLKA